MGQGLDNIQAINLWPTTLFSTVIQTDTASVKEEIYKLKVTSVGQHKSNYGGWQSHTNLHTNPKFLELCNEIISVLSILFRKNIVFDQMWACVNQHKDFNVVHAHGNKYHISGVFYLQVFDNSGQICFRDPRPAAINAETTSFFNQGDTENFTPCNNQLIVFPSFLEHFVTPNETHSDRISISFDATFGE
jgi:uncharacterized protein (TIGR02466 family)